MKSRAAAYALVAIALFVTAGQPSPAAGAAAVEKDVVITLKINDKASGLTLEVKKKVARGTVVFDMLRHTVAMAYRTDPQAGPVVTSLCGVSPAKGSAWSCVIDGGGPRTWSARP